MTAQPQRRSHHTWLSALTLTVAFAAALVVPSITVPAEPAHAAIDPTGWWYPAMGIADAHAQGWTGEGVNIAVIEGQINPDAPALAGAKLTVNEEFVCGDSVGVTAETTDSARHGVGVVQLLVRPFGIDGDTGGIAPGANIQVYVTGNEEDECTFDSVGADQRSAVGRAIVAAVDAGNDIISISRGLTSPAEDYEALAYALANDVIVVSSSPNDENQVDLTFPVGANGVVSVAAVSETLDLMVRDDNSGPVVTPEITVVAPGINIGKVGDVGDWSGLSTGNGSSSSAPLVAGVLALAKQKFPTATGNQLIQALIHTTASAQNGLGRDTTNGYGYGFVSLAGILSSDPLSYPDENPLMDKSGGLPSAEDVAAVNEPTPTPEPEETASPKPTKTAAEVEESLAPEAAENGGPGVWPWLLGGGIMLAGIAVVVVSVIKFRRQPGQSEGGL